MRSLPALVLLAPLLTGCDGSALAEKTYPPAADFIEVSVADLMAAEVGLNDLDPGRYNVAAYVARVYACPASAECPVPDNIVLAPSLASDPIQPAVTVPVDRDGQFQVGDRHTFSVEMAGSADGVPLTLRLLGYDPQRLSRRGA